MDADYWKRKAEKSEWIHHKYVEMYEPYKGRKLESNEQTFLKKEMNKIDKEADKKFGIF